MPNNNIDLQKQALSKIKQINKKLKAYDELGLKGYAFREIQNELYQEDNSIYTKGLNLSTSKATLSSYSEPRLKDFVASLDKVLKNENVRTKKGVKAFAERKRKEATELEESQTQAWEKTMRDRYQDYESNTNKFDDILKYVYNGDKKQFYIDFVMIKEGESATLDRDSDFIIDYMYKQNAMTIKNKKEKEEETLNDKTAKHFGLMTEEDKRQRKAQLDKIRNRRKR